MLSIALYATLAAPPAQAEDALAPEAVVEAVATAPTPAAYPYALGLDLQEWTVDAAVAEDEEESEESDESSVKEERDAVKSGKADEKPAEKKEKVRKKIIKTIQQKTFMKLHRYEAGVGLGFVANDPFLNRYIINGTFDYHVTEVFAIEAHVAYAPILGQGGCTDPDWKSLSCQLLEQNSVSPDISRLTAHGNVGLQFAPIYGKAAVGRKIIAFDIFGTVGLGATQTTDDLVALQAVGVPEAQATEKQVHPTTTLGGGARVAFSELLAVRAEVKSMTYIETVKSTTLEMKNNLIVQTNVSFFFPGDEVMSTVLFLALVQPASALTCDEVMNMVNVNVPENIVVQTVEESGETFSADFLRCLTNEGAPDAVIAAVKSQIAKTAAPVEEAAPEEEAAPKSSKQAAKEEFDSEEEIGSKSSSKSKTKELVDKGGDEEEDDSRDPEKLDDAIRLYKAKKWQSATLALHDILKDNSFPDKETKILYYMGMALFDGGMYHSSQYYFIEVLKKGTGTPYFKYALPKLVTIAKYTGDSTDLEKVVAKVPPEEFPRSARNNLYYLLGVRLYEQDKLSEAKKMLGQVSEKSDLYTRAKYLEGVINNKQGKLKSAVRSFSEVAKTKAEAPTLQELEQLDRLKDLSVLNIARIYYGISQFDQAKEYYSQVPRDSIYWPQAEFEAGWTSFMLTDLNLTLGQMLTVESPYYNTTEFVPEATILKALTYFQLCQYSDVERTLLEFEQNFSPVHAELKDVLQTYSSEQGRELADQAFERYFEGKGDTTIPKPVFTRLLRDQELAGLVTHLDLLDKEEQLIASQKSQWKGAVGEELLKIIAGSRERLKKRAGKALLRDMVDLTRQLGDLIGQAQIIRFEVVDARRVDYTYRLQNLDLLDTSKDLNIDFATSPKFIYWPFNGEFWKDELGWYRYTEQAKCK